MISIIMPQVGQDIPKAKIVRWLKRKGIWNAIDEETC